MSTRSQIRVIENGKHFDLYHHCDGYFEGVGSELKDALEKNASAFGLIASLMEDEQYEKTDCLHGDVEFYYELDFDENVFKGYALEFSPWREGAKFSDLHPAFMQHKDITMDLKTGEINGKIG